jgi:hypothetical protein
MRIGGGIGSNEGDTPIYIANIHPHGCIGKSKQLRVSIFYMSGFLSSQYRKFFLSKVVDKLFVFIGVCVLTHS